MYGIITKVKSWFKQHLPDEKVQTGEQVTAVLKNKEGLKTCIKTN